MKNNKNGFTLIELLAVIVILGVLLLIAVPSVNKILEQSKDKAFIAQAQLYLKAAKQEMVISGETRDNVIFYISDLDKENSTYTGKVLAEKNPTTKKYEYSISLFDSKANKEINGVPYVRNGVQKQVPESELSINNINKVEFKSGTNYEVSNTEVLTPSGNKILIEPNTDEIYEGVENGTNIYYRFEYDSGNSKRTVDWTFKVLRDSGSNLYLLLDSVLNNPNGTYPGPVSYKDAAKIIEKYYGAFIQEEKAIVEKVRLLTMKDLAVYLGVEPTFENVQTFVKENKDTLIKLFGNDIKKIRNYPNFVATGYIAELGDACNMDGVMQGVAEDNECYAIDFNDANVNNNGMMITRPANKPFNLRLVFVVTGENRKNFFFNPTLTQPLENFGVSNLEEK